MFAIVFVCALAGLLVLTGLWGYRRSVDLAVVPGMDGDRIQKRRRVLRRGAVTCVAVGALFVLAIVLSLAHR